MDSGVWSTSDGVLTHTSNPNANETACTSFTQGALLYKEAPEDEKDTLWLEMAVQGRVRTGSSSEGIVGLVFHMRRADDGRLTYSVLELGPGCIRLSSFVDGSNTFFQQYSGTDIAVQPDTWYTVRAELVDSTVVCYVESVQVFSVATPGGVDRGGVGFLSALNSGASFDDLYAVRGTGPCSDSCAYPP